ncbi:MAG: flavodoxin family protein [Candidatus Helarchaeota archaeon]
MKILVTYYTQTGNTEIMAKKIEEALNSHDVTVKEVKNTDPNEISQYDLVFLGTGVYANGITGQLKKFLKGLPEGPAKFAFFVGHANPDPAFWAKPIKKMEKTITQKNAEVVAKFDCIGENKDEKVVALLKAQMPQLIPAIESAVGHPNDADLENLKNFAVKTCDECK